LSWAALRGSKKAPVAIASVPRHIDKSHPMSLGVGSTNVAQFQQRAILDCGKGDNFLSGAHAQNIALRDDLQDDLLGSGHHNGPHYSMLGSSRRCERFAFA